MAKKNRKKRAGDHAVDGSGSGELTHNPFGALQGISAPPGTLEPRATPEAEDSPSDGPRRSSQGAEEGPGDPLRAAGKVVVRRERAGRGGKTVTRVSGLPAGALDEVARRMKTALGCGATVEGPDLLLLGDLVERGARWFEAQGARQVVRGN